MGRALSLAFTTLWSALAVLSGLPVSAQAQTYVGEAQIAVVTPLSFIQIDNLDFGRIVSTNVAGTVTLSAAGVRTATGGAIPVGNDFEVARFAGMGTQGQRVRIQISPNTITLTGPGPSMTATNFTTGSGSTLQQNGASPNYRILPANGIFWFTIGGRLNVGANQPSGTYSGVFTVMIDYQ